MLALALACSLSLAGCGGGSTPVDNSSTALLSTGTATTSAGTTDTVASVDGLSFSYDLPAARSTSAGVHDVEGRLVRTLWRGRSDSAGHHVGAWDGRSDAGQLLSGGTYTVKLIHHRVRYEWDGVVGNNTDTSGAPMRSLLPPVGLAATPVGLAIATDYNEGQSGVLGFALNQPRVERSAIRIVNPFVAVTAIASDGQTLYWVNAGGFAKYSFVAGYDLASGKEQLFSTGKPICLNYHLDRVNCYAGQGYASVLDLRTDLSNPPTGIAVQKNGHVLALAYAAEGVVRLHDKRSGALLRTIDVAPATQASNALAMSPDGDLWVISGNNTLRYTALDSQPVLATIISGLTHPLAVTVDGKDRDKVWIADGGTSQQLKRYDHLGAPQVVVGSPGGCTTSVEVSPDRLCFMRTHSQELTALAVDDNHAVWVIDAANNRLSSYDANGQWSDQVAWLPGSYCATVDTANPTRVFSNYLEFEVDYSRPLSDPKAWRLVRNWLPRLPAPLREAQGGNFGFSGLRTVQTMGNGRTYGLMGTASGNWLAELTSDGNVRPVRAMRAASANETTPVLYENGDIGWAANSASATGMRQAVLRQALQGYDAAGNPVWDALPSMIASVPLDTSTPSFQIGTFTGVSGPRFPVSGSGDVIWFNPSVMAESAYHLGAVRHGGKTWAWQASPSGVLDGLGTFQTLKDDPRIQYGGNLVWASGRSVVYGYHGEFYSDASNGGVGQANQFMHFHDSGLFIGQFGVASTRATSPLQPGLSGNAFSSTLLRAAGQTYLYHNDESTHGGVHRWHLAGIDDVQELTASASLPRAASNAAPIGLR
jgi:hypothetical protein